MEGSIGVALIGRGFMGRAHSNAYAQAPRFFELPLTPVLRVACARDGERLERFARVWGWQRATTRWQELAEDAEVELVDVSAPNHLHADVSLAMLEAGKHVACEKPLARNLAEARAMREASRSARGRTFVWFNYRRCPAVALARRLVSSGRLGRVLHVRARYLQSWGGAGTEPSWRFVEAQAGSGAHGDLNAHSIDLARFLTGDEVEEVHGAAARTFVRERRARGAERGEPCDVDDALAFTAGLASGALATFEASRVALGHLNDNAIEVGGELGAVRFRFEEMNVLELHDARDEAWTQGWRRIDCTDPAHHPWVASWWPPAHPIGYEHTFTNMVADMMCALAGGTPEVPLCDFEDAYQTQRVLEAALIAARERCSVPLREVT